MIELTIMVMGMWLYLSVEPCAVGDVKLLFGAVAILVVEALSTRIYEKIMKVDAGFVRLSILLTGVGLLLAYPYGEMESAFKTVAFSAIAILLGYIFVKTGIYRFKVVGAVAVCSIPILLIFTRLVGHEINGAYLSIGPILTLALIIMCLPIACGYCITNEVEGFASSTKSIPANQMILLVLTMLVAVIAGLVNNEYGTACIVCVTIALLFMIYGRNFMSKFVFAGTSSVAMLLAMMASTKLKSRLLICLNIDRAMELYPKEAQPVKHIQDLISFSGLYGVGHGALSKSIIQNVTSDYVASGLIFNTGLIFTGIVVLLLIVLIIHILMMNTSTRYEKVILESIGYIFGVMTLFSTGGPIGSFILSGVGMPLVSTSTSINLALFTLMGMVLCIKERMAKEYV